jgi:hypothetical protein
LYARVSSDKQAQEGTIASQLSVLRERIAADGYVLEEALSFVDDYHDTSDPYPDAGPIPEVFDLPEHRGIAWPRQC